MLKNAGIVADSGTGDDGTNGGNIAVLGAGTLVAGGALFATGMISIGIIMSTFATAALILGAIFLLLVFRQMLVIGLVLVAPLAILSWIFPGNDKLWKLWWGSFSKLLLIFPLIMLHRRRKLALFYVQTLLCGVRLYEGYKNHKMLIEAYKPSFFLLL